jgi:putative colanic acid biosynthesis acetyltransferase WcaB
MTYKEIRSEVRSNPEKRSRFVIYLFRCSGLLTNKKNPLFREFGKLIGAFYAFYTGWILGIDLSYNTRVGLGLKIFHAHGLVIHADSIIGQNVVLRQNTTIGQAHDDAGSPIIGDNVNIGANCIIIGEISIGENCVIGAGSVVNKSFPPNSIIAGNPGKQIGSIK